MILLLGGTGRHRGDRRGAGAGRLSRAGLEGDRRAPGRGPARPHREPLGPLEESGLAELLAGRKIRAVVDATHPYATTIRATARRVAERMRIPYLSFLRPPAIDPQAAGVQFAADHAAAARAAFACGRPVLLTTGAGNLAPYAEESRRTGLPLVVRVLERPASRAACRQAGIPDERVVAGRGPFSVEENRRHIRAFGIGVLVTKDSGRPGGVAGKARGGPRAKAAASWSSAGRNHRMPRRWPAWRSCCGRCGKSCRSIAAARSDLE